MKKNIDNARKNYKIFFFYICNFLISVFLLIPLIPIHAQVDSLSKDIKDSIHIIVDSEHLLFGPNDPLNVTLKFDIEEFIKKRYDPKYVDAEISMRFNKTDSITQRIKIKPSGDFRRTFCLFPPIHISFKRTEFLSTEKTEQQTIKLVTHCKNARAYTVYVLREYLAYRLYNLITPYSLQVRLLNIHYVDRNNAKNQFTRYGFLIENSYNMAERTHSVLQKDAKFSRENLLMDEVTRVAVFEYMIGNTDWAASVLHNIKLLELPDGHRIYVPHDFDYSGFVGTNYSIPDPALGITDVKERLYMGKCVDDVVLEKALREFDGYKDSFIKLIQDFPLLDKKEKKETQAYLEEFFALLKDKPSLVTRMKSACKDYIH